AWPVFDRTDPVLPEVTRNEVAARVAHDRRTELLDEREHVAAEAALVGLGMAGLEDAGVDAAPHVLDERAEQAARNVGQSEVAVDDDARGRHDSPVSRWLTDRRSRWSRRP